MRTWRGWLTAGTTALAVAALTGASVSGQLAPRAAGQPAAGSAPLYDSPVIQYFTRPTSDPVARLKQALADGTRTLARDERTGYLRPLLDALGIPHDSQLLVFSKTSVQRPYTNPHTPRALYFDDAVAVSYVPGAPALEIAAHDPQQGMVFYSLDQAAAAPALQRETSCLACHVAPGTLGVPGAIARSTFVKDDGTPMAVAHDVDHRTPHPDRWAGWFVTSEDGPAPYSDRAHAGNITFEENGIFSDQVFVDWMNSSPESRGYLSRSSDIAALLVFDHQMHAINLLTKVDWEYRIAAAAGHASATDGAVGDLVSQLADYLLFLREASIAVPLTPQPGFAAWLASKAPKDRRGRSFGELNLEDRLLQYPCSYMIYSESFDALPAPVRQAVYRKMIERLSRDSYPYYSHVTAAGRAAILEILRETKPDFPRS